MSSTESSGAPAEATATPPAPAAAFPTFGNTRGSGLARGKRPSVNPVSAASAAPTGYTPTAIEVVTSPREYQNPFAPAETPAAVTPEPVAAPAATASVTPVVSESFSAPVVEKTPVDAPVEAESTMSDASAPAESAEPAELNILPPEQPKSTPAQTWESEGFRPAREPRADRPRREERSERAPRDERPAREEIPTPEKFLYVRPGYNYVPTPSNYGGAPRERDSAPAPSRPVEAAAVVAPKKSGGILGWLKSVFSGPSAAPAVEVRSGEPRRDGPYQNRPQRGGRGRGPGGEKFASNGEGDGYGGQRRRHRGGRGRNQRSGEYRGGDQGGPAAT